MNDIRGRADDSLTAEYAWNIGKALADWLPDEGTVAIAASSNVNETLAHALCEGVLLQGRDVAYGASSTRETAITAIAEKRVVGGVSISHDDVSGLEIIELFNAQGQTVTSESGLAEINQLIEAGNFVPSPQKGTLSQLTEQ